MATVVWTASALDDLENIRRFVERDSERLAERLVRRILASTRQLERFPESGRVVPELNYQDVREVLTGRYRVIYRLRGVEVRVVMVRHTARLLAADDLGNDP